MQEHDSAENYRQLRVSYLTSKKYPGLSADHIYIRELSHALHGILNDRFYLLVRRNAQEVAAIGAQEVKPYLRSRALSSLLFLLRVCIQREPVARSTHIITNEQLLLLVLIFVRSICWKNYKIVFDAHILSDTRLDRLTLRLADHVITTSDELHRQVCARLPKRLHRKVTTIWGGVDPTPYQAANKELVTELRQSLGLANTQLVGYVGGFRSLGHEKGLRTLIAALPHLPASFRVLLVGGAEAEVRELQEYAATIGVAKQCVILPKVPFSDVARYQMACDVLVIPYPDEPHFRDYGFPMKVFEYMAATRPIVYSDLPIMSDFLHDKATKFTPGDAVDLARAIDCAISKNKQKIFDVEPYTWNAKAKEILHVISQ